MVYITADTHGELSRLTDRELKKIKIGDTLIILGDFGYLWGDEKTVEKNLKKISKLPFKTVFIDGYNDDMNVISRYPQTVFHGAKAREIVKNKLFYVERGETAVIDDCKILFFGGRDDPDDDCFSDFVPNEADFENRMENLAKCGNKTDYILTHSPSGATERFINQTGVRGGNTKDFLDRLRTVCEYKKWYFGCIHKDKYISSKCQAVFENIIKLGE